LNNQRHSMAWVLGGAVLTFGILIILALQGGWNPGMIPATPAQAARFASYNPTVVLYAYNVRTAPTISEAHAESILCGAPHGNFNCRQLANQIYADGVQYRINPAFILAVFKEESSFGSTGMARYTLDVPNMICIKPADWNAGITFTCLNGFTKTRTWGDSVILYCRLLNGKIYQGRDDVKDIIQIATPSTNNPTNRYIADVEQNMTTWQNEPN
jgi:hypothetical protein